MFRFAYLFLAPYFFFSQESPELSAATMDVTPATDTCRVVTEYEYAHKVLEGMVCNDRREGLWREWYTDGRLKDSAMYKGGVRLYAPPVNKKIKGTIAFRNNPKQFYKDSTYECSVNLNVYHGLRDIKGDYEGESDTAYPPLLYFGVDLGARDAYHYYFTPKATGKYKLRISLAGDGAAAGPAAFYEQEIEVVRK